jgi:hypothetical protein
MTRREIVPGDEITTAFLRGIVIEVIDGLERGWTDAVYYRVRVTKPESPRPHIVSQDEILLVCRLASSAP